MQVEQFVMAYGAEQDRLRAILPDGFTSLRPVLRINAEIWADGSSYLEFNTAVEHDGKKGWLNIGHWENVPFEKTGKTTMFETEFLKICFTRVGVKGGCPAEKDNAGCYFLAPQLRCRAPETMTEPKEFCDCRFRWKIGPDGAQGVSEGKTLPAVPQPPKTVYPKRDFTVAHAAEIACRQVLGAYAVEFSRTGSA